MSLLDRVELGIKDEYFYVWEVLEKLYSQSNNDWDDVAIFLAHHSFDKNLQLFILDYDKRIVENNGKINPIEELIENLRALTLPFNTAAQNQEYIRLAKLKVSNCLWRKKDLYQFNPILELCIFKESVKYYGAQSDEILILEDRIKELEDTLQHLMVQKNITTYKTPALNALYGVINEFWKDYDVKSNMPAPKQDYVKKWISLEYPEIDTDYMQKAIDKICRHPDAKNGGNYKR